MSDRMTEQRLQELEALAIAATPGPWEWQDLLGIGVGYLCGNDPEYVAVDEGGMSKADADFIAASRTAIPELLAEVRRLRDKINRQQEHHIRAVHDADAVSAQVYEELYEAYVALQVDHRKLQLEHLTLLGQCAEEHTWPGKK